MSEASEKLLGQAIQEARQAAGLTQQQLCQKAELSYSTLAKIERGAIKTPSVFTVMKLAQILGVSVDGLMGATVDTSSTYSTNNSKKKSKSGISFLYMDINGCLVRFFHSAFTKISAYTEVPSEVIESAFWHYNDAVCRGEISMDDFNSRLSAKLGLKELDWSKYYLDAVEPIVESHELMIWAAKHYKIGLLSNIMPGQIQSLIENGKLPDIKYDVIIDSSQVGAIKPEADIYKIAEAETDVKPEEILFIDDSRTNLMAAERQNWRVMWFDDYDPAVSVEKIKQALEF
jgi:FMN phosphatase YigB (HAD superfamily)/DNA-binding XRE family transcriptional regulator